MSGAGQPLDFDIDCRLCPRLVALRHDVQVSHPAYHAAPVAPFGDPNGRLLIVGLAPGMHGANASGRPFTGDHAGGILYRNIYEAGFSNRPESLHADDGLKLIDCKITNAVKCLPPKNKPTGEEVNTCNRFLQAEVRRSPVLLALGSIAHQAVLKAFNLKLSAWRFGHAAEHLLPGGHILLDSYHCSRYNTQTRRLTETMFADIFRRARALVDAA
jgi:uracil-DNA glycosylase family 4